MEREHDEIASISVRVSRSLLLAYSPSAKEFSGRQRLLQGSMPATSTQTT